MCVVEIGEAGFQCALQRVIHLHCASRVDVHREVFASRISIKPQLIAIDGASQLDRITVRPVKASRDGFILLNENKLQRQMLDRKCPVALDLLLPGVGRTGRKPGDRDYNGRL